MAVSAGAGWLAALSVGVALTGFAPVTLRAESGGAQGLQSPQEANWGVPHLPDDPSAPPLPTVTPKTAEDCKAYGDFIDGLNKRLEANKATRDKLNGLTLTSTVETNGRRAYLTRLDAIDANLKARIAEAQKKQAECTDKFKTAPPGGGPAGGGQGPDPKALCKECEPLLDVDLALIKAFAAMDDKVKTLNIEITKLNAKKNRTADETKTLNGYLATRKTADAEYKALRDRSKQVEASRAMCKKVLCEKPAVCPECEPEGKKLADQAAELKKVWDKLVALIGKEIDASKQAAAGKDELALEDVRDDIEVALTAEKNAKTEYDKLKAKLDTCQKEKCPPKEKGHGDGSFRTVPESGQFYVGFGGGAGFGSSSWEEQPVGTDNFSVSGFVAGGHAGRQIAGGQVPVAVEGDFALTGLSGDTLVNCGSPCKTSNRWIATARARVSVPVGGSGAAPFTPYVTGGVAFGNVRADVGAFPGATATRAGWTLGGGVEFPFLTHSARAMSARVEFKHIDLGRAAICTPAACGGQAAVSFAANLVTFAISLSLGR